MENGLENQAMLEVAQNNMADPAATAAPVPQMPQEKMLSQSEVNELAGKIRADAFEKGKRSASVPDDFAAQRAATGGLSEEQVKDMILAETQKIQQEQAMQLMAERVVNEFAGKMATGAEKHQDFNDVVRGVTLDKIPEIVQLANAMPNTSDVMYDLAKNPYKIAQLKTLSGLDPQMAMREMHRLSQSIMANESAQASMQNVKQPLGQMKSSSGTVDTAPSSVSDFRKASWLKA